MQRREISKDPIIIPFSINGDSQRTNENMDLELSKNIHDLELEKVINNLEVGVHNYTTTNIYQAFKILIDGNWLPEYINTPEVAMTVQKFGAEVGLPMMQSFMNIIPIEGKLTLSARALSGIMRSRGVRFVVTKYAENVYNVNGVIKTSPDSLYALNSDEHKKYYMGKVTEIKARRRFEGDSQDTEQIVRYSTKDAETQGLLTKDNWKRLLSEMLFARCVSRLNNVFCTDLTLGIPSTEEIVDMHKHLSLTYEGEKVRVLNIQ